MIAIACQRADNSPDHAMNGQCLMDILSPQYPHSICDVATINKVQ